MQDVKLQWYTVSKYINPQLQSGLQRRTGYGGSKLISRTLCSNSHGIGAEDLPPTYLFKFTLLDLSHSLEQPKEGIQQLAFQISFVDNFEVRSNYSEIVIVLVQLVSIQNQTALDTPLYSVSGMLAIQANLQATDFTILAYLFHNSLHLQL